MAHYSTDDSTDELSWFRVTANVMASSPEEAANFVERGLPPEVQGSLGPSHVCDVEEAEVYTVQVAWREGMPPPEQDWLVGVIAVNEEEARQTLLRDGKIAADQIGLIRRLDDLDDLAPT